MTKEQLKQYVNIQKNNQWLRDKIQELEAEAEGMNIKLKQDHVKSTPAEQDKMAKAVAKMVDYQEELEEGERKVAEVREVLDKLEKPMSGIDPTLVYILRRRYIDGAAWIIIRRELGVREAQAYRLHRQALKIFCNLINDSK